MRSQREQDFLKKRDVPWDSTIVAELQWLSPLSYFGEIAGINDHPWKLIRGEASISSKINAILQGGAALATTFKAILYTSDPSLVPDDYLPSAHLKDMSSILMPISSIMICLIRLALAIRLHNKSYLSKLRETTCNVVDDPHLRNHRVDMKKIRAVFAIVVFAVLVTVVGSASSMISVEPHLVRKPIFYVFLFESYLYLSAISLAGCYVTIVTVFIVLPLLRLMTKAFEDAVKSTDTQMLQSAIGCHDVCRHLIEAVDDIVRGLSGALVLNGVPTVAVAASSLSRLQREEVGFMFKFTIGGAVAHLSLMMIFIHVASAVHDEAHKPRKILANKIILDEKFLKLSSQFSERFLDQCFGLTFFGLVTIRKETVLSVASLITTYVIIALQMKSP